MTYKPQWVQIAYVGLCVCVCVYASYPQDIVFIAGDLFVMRRARQHPPCCDATAGGLGGGALVRPASAHQQQPETYKYKYAVFSSPFPSSKKAWLIITRGIPKRVPGASEKPRRSAVSVGTIKNNKSAPSLDGAWREDEAFVLHH